MSANASPNQSLPVRRGRPPFPVKAMRVNVLKPGTRARTKGNHKTDLTCVYLSGQTVLTFLALTDGDRALIGEAVRRAAVGARAKDGVTFSETVLKRAKSLLAKYRRALDEEAEAVAAANNAAWAGVA